MFFSIRLWLVSATFMWAGAVGLNAVCAEDWLRFRGPNGAGVTADAVPTRWSDTEGMQWKTELPGSGVSSPIIVGDRVFVTCYSGYGVADANGSIEDLKRHLVCLERSTGKILWTKTVDAVLPEDPYNPPGVTSHGYASHTPTSDGKLVFAFFGKSGVFAYDLEGNEVWKANVGTGSGPQAWGSASSPVVHDELVIVTAAEESTSLVAFDKSTGKEVWKAKADGLEGTWGTPAVVKTAQGTEVVLSVPGEIWGFNAETGKLRWYSRGTTDSSASASVAVDGDVIYAVGGRNGDAVAVRAGGKGDVNGSAVVWDANIQGRFASPIAFNGYLFTVNNDVVGCFDAKTGDKVAEKRLPSVGTPAPAPSNEDGGGRRGGGRFGGTQYASPIIANGKLYVTLKSGTVHVLDATPELNVIASNQISGDASGFDATPAASAGQLILRSGKNVYAIASP